MIYFKNYFLKALEQMPKSEARVAKLLELFDQLDTDGSGIVTTEKVKEAVEPLARIFAEQVKDSMAGFLMEPKNLGYFAHGKYDERKDEGSQGTVISRASAVTPGNRRSEMVTVA